MVKKAQSVPAPSAPINSLRESVDQLAAEIRLLREVMDEIREDFSWVTRNGLPQQPIEHIVVKQMALNPCAKDWGDRLVIERHTRPSNGPLESSGLENVAAELTTTLNAIAEGQFEVVLAALDKVRSKLQSAVQQPQQTSGDSISLAHEGEGRAPVAVPDAAREKPPPGRLF